MGDLTAETNGSLVENKDVKETLNVQQPSKEAEFGELIWVKLHETSWWPAQVVDENLVSSANKPSIKGSSSDVLVRLYGSYIYKYVDVRDSNAEFKNILIKNNCNYHDIIKKSMEQDLPSLSSSKSRKRKQSKSKGKVTTEGSQNGALETKTSSKKRKQEKPKTKETKTKEPKLALDGVNHDTDPSTPNTATRYNMYVYLSGD